MEPLEGTTFSNAGDEGNLLTLADINKLANMVWQKSRQPRPSKIVQNGCEEWFKKNLAAIIYGSVVAFCGIPIRSSAGVPKGEFWILDQNNQILQRYKIAL